MKQMSNEFIESLREGKTNVFDWYLFSRILLNGGVGKKINNTVTYYRIYEDNIAGLSSYSLKTVEKEKSIKLLHYKLLEKYDVRYTYLLKKYENIDINSSKRDIGGNQNHFWWNLIN
jgi:hypothetical protein